MSPIITSIAGLAATLTGTCAMLLMLEMRGNPKGDSKINQRLIKAHKVTGYIFIAFFIVILVIMLAKAGTYEEEFSPRTILHISLALLVIPLLFFKVLIIRRFKRFERQVPSIGLSVFLALFLLNSMTAGYYFLHESNIGQLSLSEEDAAVLDEKKGQKLVAQKCGKCHTLERVFKALKTDQGWTETVNRMVSFDMPNIRESQGKQVLNYLINQQKRQEKLSVETLGVQGNIGRKVVGQKCSFCHGLDRIYMADKTSAEWTEVVGNMIGYSEQAEFMSPQEKESVIDFLSSRSSADSEKKK
ncbi:MAG: photosystem P840 reaction-center cytochrome c-551 [Candidatus Electrothrix sp.]